MREIKFRGRTAQGKWLYGDLEYRRATGVAVIHTYNEDGTYNRQEQVNPSTVGQFTGLHDKNGKGIYEGDIIRIMYEIEVGKGRNRHVERAPVANDTPKVIDFRDGAFGYVNFYASTYQNEEWLPLLDELCEVIGNIHDNPELLKGGEK